MKAAVLVTVMALFTMLLRFLPFLIFRKNTPPYIAYLGRVLPPAIIGMLVIYCLKDVSVLQIPYGLPELASAGIVIAVQIWKRNSIWSILSGTAVYMILIRIIS